MEQKRQRVRADAGDVHPVFTAEYEMPLKTASAFFDFEAKLVANSDVRQNLVSILCFLFTRSRFLSLFCLFLLFLFLLFLFLFLSMLFHSLLFLFFFQITILRSLGGETLKDATKLCWKECVSDSLLAQGTWTGAARCVEKDRNLKFGGSQLAQTINSKSFFAFRFMCFYSPII